MHELKVIEDLIASLKVIPGIGNKSAERIAYEFLKMDEGKVNSLINALTNIKKDVSICPNCGAYIENDTCEFCLDKSRNQDTLIVVSSYKDVLAFERLPSFHVKYHILNGSISPSKGISASDINISKLLSRIEQEQIKEVILATNPTIDGETTALYIAKLLEKYDNIKISRLAYGLPMGANLDYTDDLTLSRALEGRINYRK